MVTIRVTTRNNSDARDFVVLHDIDSAKCRHNGGKLVVVTLDASDVAAAKRLLDDSRAVAEYTVHT